MVRWARLKRRTEVPKYLQCACCEHRRRTRAPLPTLADPHGQLCRLCWRALHGARLTWPREPSVEETQTLRAAMRDALAGYEGPSWDAA